MVATLEDCKSLCANFQGCVGIEYNAGGQRCEIWTRPEGIEVTKEAAGYVCLKYLPNAPTTTSINQALFQPLSGDGTGQVCRGEGPGDNLPEYFTVKYNIPSLEGCQAECVAVADCKGIEYNAGGSRCEIWIRPEGIGSTFPLDGYTCLAYTPNLPTTTSTTSTLNPALFQPVMGDGTDQVCRGVNAGDNADTYFTVTSAASLEACKVACVGSSSCKGIEYHVSGRCEIWTRPEGIGTTMTLADYTCLRYVPGASDQ